VRNLPHLGQPREEWTVYLCDYSPDLGEPHCNRDAPWHGFVLDDPAERIVAMMMSCDDHLRFMKLTADYVHRVEHPCGIPGSMFRWPENECYTDWDEAELTALRRPLAGAR
jgi:hypothetical protein